MILYHIYQLKVDIYDKESFNRIYQLSYKDVVLGYTGVIVRGSILEF